jgi:WD40 repeat protein
MRAIALLLLLDVTAGAPTFHPKRLGLLKSLCPHTQPIATIGFSPDGRWLVTCGEDGRIHLIRTGSWTVERTIEEHAIAFAVSPDSRRLATVNPDGSVRLWSLMSGQKESDLAVQSIFLQAVAFSPDGRKLVGLESDGRLRAWDPRSGKELYQVDGVSPSSPTIVFSPDSSEFLAVRMNGVVTIFSSADGKEKGQFEAILEPLRLAIGPDGKKAVCAAGDGTIRILDLPSRKVVKSIGSEPLENMPVLALTDDARFAVGSKGNTVDVHDLRDGGSTVLKHHTAGVIQVAVSRNNRYIASVASDSQVKIWGYRPQGMKGIKPKGFLGVMLNEDGNGCVVDQVIEKTAAEKAGIQVNDRIVKIQGVDVKSTWHAIGLIGGNDEGAAIEVVIERDGKEKTLNVTLGPRPENP